MITAHVQDDRGKGWPLPETSIPLTIEKLQQKLVSQAV
jgi:hypothetical protein